MSEKNWFIDLRKGDLDNEYTIYENGNVTHFYDQNHFKPNLTREMHIRDLSSRERKLILEKCSDNTKAELQVLFDQFPES